MDITKIAYEKYKLDWMIQHGYTLQNLVTELGKMIYEDFLDGPNVVTSVLTLFEDWEYAYGFNSEIWACYDEFMDIEFYDSEYMKSLLTSNEYYTYMEYVRENPFGYGEDEDEK